MNLGFGKQLIAILALAGALAMPVASEDDLDAGGVLYRYYEDGRQVVQQSLPPDVAPKGYDIISKSGHLLKKVPPAPKGTDIEKMVEQMRIEAELAEWDSRLRRRYSTEADIEAAKRRSLSELQGTVSLLQANLGGVIAQIEDQQRRAAILERTGRKVSETVLNNIQSLEQERVGIEQQIEQRGNELQQDAARFDRDIER
ncbi:MAG TPA: hypothetical protein VIC08_08140, partial [Cellvibrionaceae bacterium]